MDEIDIVSQNLPIESHLSKYLVVKTKVNYYDDCRFRLALKVDDMVRKFDLFSYDMKPMVVGVKLYTGGDSGCIDVWHYNRDKSLWQVIDSAVVEDQKWYTFKYPLVANYHTETYINVHGCTSYSLAILNCPQRAKRDWYPDSFSRGFRTVFESYCYSSSNPPIVFYDPSLNLENKTVGKTGLMNDKLFNPFYFDLSKSVIIPSTKMLLEYGTKYKEHIVFPKEPTPPVVESVSEVKVEETVPKVEEEKKVEDKVESAEV
jgi:hypothetical protein